MRLRPHHHNSVTPTLETSGVRKRVRAQVLKALRDMGFVSAMALLPLASQAQDAYDTTQFQSTGGASENDEKERPANDRLSEKIKKHILTLSQALHLDPELMARLVLTESNGNPKVRHPKGHAGLMQLNPSIPISMSRRFDIFGDMFHAFSNRMSDARLSPEAASLIPSKNKERVLVDPYIQWSLKQPLNLFDPDTNLVIGHAFMAGIRSQARMMSSSLQKRIAAHFQKLPPEGYQELVALRKRIGKSVPSLAYIQGTYAHRIATDKEFAAQTLALLQYNGGGNPPPASYVYAASIQIESE